MEDYRYIRFFPDGHGMVLTIPEEPQSIAPRLRTRNTRTDSVLLGHYRLSQDADNQTKVFAVVTKKKEGEPLDYKYRYFLYKKQIPVFMWGCSCAPMATRGSTNSSGSTTLVTFHTNHLVRLQSVLLRLTGCTPPCPSPE